MYYQLKMNGRCNPDHYFLKISCSTLCLAIQRGLCNFSQHYDAQKAHKMADSFSLVDPVQYSTVTEHRLTVPASVRRNAAPTKQNPLDKDEDYLMDADTLGVNRSTARGIVAQYIQEGRIHERPQGGGNHVCVDDEMRDCLEEIINENCFLTLYQINRELQRRLPDKPIIHDHTVARTLDGMLFKVKLARPLAADKNRPKVLDRRWQYANWFIKHAVLRHTVFMDECSYNIWTARSHWRARRGERAYRQVCGQRGCNMTVSLALSPINSLVFHSAYLGGMDAVWFGDLLVQARLNLDPDETVIFIYDGTRACNNPGDPGANTKLEKLPAYSPFLNIVEQAISTLKAAIKTDISRPEVQLGNRDEAIARGIPLGEFRTQLLLEALQRSIGTITLAKCTQGLCKHICLTA